MSAPPDLQPRFDPKRRRAVLVALSLVTILASFEATVVSTAMPTIIGELEGLPLYSWVFAVYLLYLGLPRVMRGPQDKAAGYTAVVAPRMAVADVTAK